MRPFRALAPLFLTLSLAPALADHGTASVSGTVTEASGGAAVEGICVELTDLDEGAEEGSRRESTTGPAGSYRFERLPGSTYVVRFSDCRASPTLVAEWYPDARYEFEAEEIVVAGDVTEIDATLDEGGFITGMVTDPSGPGIEDMCVRAYGDGAPPDDHYTYHELTVHTDESGTFWLGPLAPAGHRLDSFSCQEVPYEHEWFDDKGSYADADPVLVSLDAPVSVEIELEPVPATDLAVTSLEIEDSVLHRDVVFGVANLGSFSTEEIDDPSWFRICVSGETRGRGRIAEGTVHLDKGEHRTYRVPWELPLEAGEVVVTVIARAGWDYGHSNSFASVRHAVIAGRGVGVTIRPDGSFC